MQQNKYAIEKKQKRCFSLSGGAGEEAGVRH